MVALFYSFKPNFSNFQRRDLLRHDCISLPNTAQSDPVKVLSQERKQSHSNVYWKIVVAIVLYV